MVSKKSALVSLVILSLFLAVFLWLKEPVEADGNAIEEVARVEAIPRKSVAKLTPEVNVPAPALDPVVATTIEQSLASIRQIERVRTEVKANPHRTPAVTIRAARALGDVEALESSHPEALPQIQAFYFACSQDEEAITVIRVQCLQRYVRSKDLSEDAATALVDTMPAYIRRVYALL